MTFKHPYTLKTWADGFGVWHCEVLTGQLVNAIDLLDLARTAIAEEIRVRGNTYTEAFLASDRFRIEYVGNLLTSQGLRYEFQEQRESAPGKRTAFFVPIDQFDANGFIPSLVTEGEYGHTPLRGGPGGTPWYWGTTYEEAVAVCAKANVDKGLSEQDVVEVVSSSMSADQIVFPDFEGTTPNG